jgi:hypothetical protein
VETTTQQHISQFHMEHMYYLQNYYIQFLLYTLHNFFIVFCFILLMELPKKKGGGGEKDAAYCNPLQNVMTFMKFQSEVY